MTKPWKPTKEQLLAATNKTVRDVIAPDLRVLFCGINPGLYTAAVGHHFARPGNRFWPALLAGGFTERLLSPFDERELLKSGLGITNMVRRTTATADLAQQGRDSGRWKTTYGEGSSLSPQGFGDPWRRHISHCLQSAESRNRSSERNDGRDDSMGSAESERTKCELSSSGSSTVVSRVEGGGRKSQISDLRSQKESN